MRQLKVGHLETKNMRTTQSVDSVGAQPSPESKELAVSHEEDQEMKSLQSILYPHIVDACCSTRKKTNKMEQDDRKPSTYLQ